MNIIDIVDFCSEIEGNSLPWKIECDKSIQLPAFEDLSFYVDDVQNEISSHENMNDLYVVSNYQKINFESIKRKTLPHSKIYLKIPVKSRSGVVQLFLRHNLGLIKELKINDEIHLLFRTERIFDKPKWNGQNNCTLFIHSHQGYGDEIFSTRYVELLKNKNIKTIFEARLKIKPFFENTEIYDQVIVKGTKLPNCDFQIDNFDLMQFYKNHHFKAKPFIISNDKNKPLLKDKINIGFCYKGSNLKIGPIRYYNPNLFHNIFKNYKNIQLYCLREKQDEKLHDDIIDLSPCINDWLDTARFVNKMDYILSVDTALLHLAGRMHKKTFAILNEDHKNFYIQFNETKSPYYETVKVFWGESSFIKGIKKDILHFL